MDEEPFIIATMMAEEEKRRQREGLQSVGAFSSLQILEFGWISQ